VQICRTKFVWNLDSASTTRSVRSLPCSQELPTPWPLTERSGAHDAGSGSGYNRTKVSAIGINDNHPGNEGLSESNPRFPIPSGDLNIAAIDTVLDVVCVHGG
jgi:hypothetical protein